MTVLTSNNSPIDMAWSAFDAAAIELHRMYPGVDPAKDTSAERARRMERAEDVLRLWNAWRALFLGDETRPAA